MKKRKIRKHSSKQGLALFILITSLVVLSLAMRELLTTTSLQISRVRNSYDRVQALYLSKSTLNLARFFILVDAVQDKQLSGKTIDTSSDLWNLPIPFPVPVQMLNTLLNSEDDSSAGELSRDQTDKLARCEEFFKDFDGDAVAKITDMSSKINLNDMANRDVQDSVEALLSPDIEFLNSLEDRNIRPIEVVHQIRDFIDRDLEDEETKGSEQDPYLNESLDYDPKNRPMVVIDELKMIPMVDDALFNYMRSYVSALYFSGRSSPSKLNLNTVGPEVFQALLKNVGNPEERAKDFIREREENSFLFSDESLKDDIESAGLEPENLRMPLIGGSAEVFLVETQARVGDMELNYEAYVKKPKGKTDRKPIVLVRVAP